MIKSILLTTKDGLLFYNKNIETNNIELIVPVYLGHKKLSEYINEELELLYDERYCVKIKNNKTIFNDIHGEHTHVNSYEHEKYNIFGVISFCKDEYYKNGEKIFNTISEEVENKHLIGDNGGVKITTKLTNTLDNIINKLNNKEIII